MQSNLKLLNILIFFILSFSLIETSSARSLDTITENAHQITVELCNSALEPAKYIGYEFKQGFLFENGVLSLNPELQTLLESDGYFSGLRECFKTQDERDIFTLKLVMFATAGRFFSIALPIGVFGRIGNATSRAVATGFTRSERWMESLAWGLRYSRLHKLTLESLKTLRLTFDKLDWILLAAVSGRAAYVAICMEVPECVEKMREQNKNEMLGGYTEVSRDIYLMEIQIADELDKKIQQDEYLIQRFTRENKIDDANTMKLKMQNRITVLERMSKEGGYQNPYQRRKEQEAFFRTERGQRVQAWTLKRM